MHIITDKLAEALSLWCEVSEIIVAYGNHNKDVEALCSNINEHKIEAHAVQVDNINQSVVLVLGMKYVFDFDEAMLLINFQPDKELLLYKQTDYVSLRKAQQMSNRAKTIFQYYFDQEYSSASNGKYDGLDEDQANIMSMIDNYEEDPDIVRKLELRKQLLYGNDASQAETVDLPY